MFCPLVLCLVFTTNCCSNKRAYYILCVIKYLCFFFLQAKLAKDKEDLEKEKAIFTEKSAKLDAIMKQVKGLQYYGINSL